MNHLFAELPTTIFDVMSNLARDLNAVNLGQGFPDDPGPEDVRRKAADGGGRSLGGAGMCVRGSSAGATGLGCGLRCRSRRKIDGQRVILPRQFDPPDSRPASQPVKALAV